MARPGESEFVVLRVRGGDLADAGDWVYTWIEETGLVVYVGATGLDPHTRIWLHVHHDDPEIGRMAARLSRLPSSELDVLAMMIPEEVSRADVRDVLGARLADEGLLADDAITDHLQLVLDPGEDALELVEHYIARLRSHVL